MKTMLHNSLGTRFMKPNILMKFQSVTTNWGAKYTWGKEKFANFDKWLAVSQKWRKIYSLYKRWIGNHTRCTEWWHFQFTWPKFRDNPGEPVPEENFWTLWCKGRLKEADTPTIQLGATPSGLTSAHLHHPPYFLQARCPSCRPTNSVEALKATSAFWLGRRRQSSPQQCYLHRLRTFDVKVKEIDTI